MDDGLVGKNISRLVKTEGSARVYEFEGGTIATALEGSIAWRNNNPGNLKHEYKESADASAQSRRTKEVALADAKRKYSGVVGLDQWGYAAFESYEAGRAAMLTLVVKNRGTSLSSSCCQSI